MFLIHKHSLLQKWNPKTNNFEDILATEIAEGDWLRGYDLFTQKFTKAKVVSRVNLMARIVKVKTSCFEMPIISEDTYLASTSGIWGYRSSTHNVKLFKKSHVMFTPKPLSIKFAELDLFVSIAISADTLLVDDFIYVTKDWNGLKIKSLGGTGATESLDAGQIPERCSGGSESR